MSMISEQIKNLILLRDALSVDKNKAKSELEIRVAENRIKIVEEVIDTIESLTNKLENSSDGWILIEERLPTEEEYLKDDGRFILDDGNRRYQGLFDIYDGKFKFSKHISGLKFELIEDKCAIAWRPMPNRLLIGRRNRESQLPTT